MYRNKNPKAEGPIFPKKRSLVRSVDQCAKLNIIRASKRRIARDIQEIGCDEGSYDLK